MIAGRWYVQHAAIWHWYLPWCVYVIVQFIASVHSLFVKCFFVCLFFRSGSNKLD